VKSKSRLRWQRLIALAIVVGFISLVAVNFLMPDVLTLAVAIVGLAGGLFVLYEIRLTKRIAQAEFIRDLNSSFSEHANIDELWRMLLLGEPITTADRHRVSSYLTFFETVHLLIARGVIEFSLIDDLFRNRFFSAVGNPGIQRTALMRNSESFLNIHDFVDQWRDFLRSRGIALPPGYYSYRRGIIESRGYQVAILGEDDVDAILDLQNEVQTSLADTNWLRDNSREMFLECLTRVEHAVVGIHRGDKLVAVGILFDGGDSPENIARYLTDDRAEHSRACNLKLVLVSPAEQRNGLASALVELCEEIARDRHKTQILCTIHPQNRASQKLFASAGFRKRKRIDSTYGVRDVFAHDVPFVGRGVGRR
jgi:ribosomal protein S18 acetylase RimI-like enzyme